MYSQRGETDTIFVAGIPAAGKSSFGRWMEAQHRYINADLEVPECIPALRIRAEWDRLMTAQDAGPLLSELRGRRQRTLLNWGFPPGCLPAVEALQRAGVELWWFDADEAAARSAYATCGKGTLVDFDNQLSQIHASWPKIERVFGTNSIKVLNADGSRLGCDQIWRQME
jgi:hypothetical protein